VETRRSFHNRVLCLAIGRDKDLMPCPEKVMDLLLIQRVYLNEDLSAVATMYCSMIWRDGGEVGNGLFEGNSWQRKMKKMLRVKSCNFYG